MTWTQTYLPLGNLLLSALVAALPVVVLLGLLAFTRLAAHLAAVAGLAASLMVAIAVYHMPIRLAGFAALNGVAYGLFPIGWIVLCAIFVYDITVATGQFEIVKRSIAGIADDRRIQAILIAFSFGAFIEGAAGFGTPVAISAAMLIGLGFRPFQAAVLNLIANTAPVAWGAIGIPVHTLALVSGLPDGDLSKMIGRILPFTAVIVPFWLVRTMVSWSETLEVLPAILVVGVSFAGMQYFWSNHVDSNLVDIAAGILSLLATLLFLRVWRPKRLWRFPEEREAMQAPTGPESDLVRAATGDQWQLDAAHPAGQQTRYTGRQIARAWLPFAILSVLVLCWGLPSIKAAMGKATTPAFASGGWNFPYLHKAVLRAQPVVTKPTPENAKFDFNWLTATGTACFLSALLAGTVLGLGPGVMLEIFGKTLHRMRFAIVAMACMLGLGYVTRYSGMDAVLGLAFTRTGWMFPFFDRISPDGIHFFVFRS